MVEALFQVTGQGVEPVNWVLAESHGNWLAGGTIPPGKMVKLEHCGVVTVDDGTELFIRRTCIGSSSNKG